MRRETPPEAKIPLIINGFPRIVHEYSRDIYGLNKNNQKKLRSIHAYLYNAFAFLFICLVIVGVSRVAWKSSEGNQRLLSKEFLMLCFKNCLPFVRSIRDPSRSHLKPFSNIFEYSGTPLMC